MCITCYFRNENGDEPKVGVAGEEIEPRRLDFNVAHHPKGRATLFLFIFTLDEIVAFRHDLLFFVSECRTL
jgi:hypothetical protein